MSYVLAYLRVSTSKQDLQNQRLEILEYARRHDLKVSEFMEIEISSRKSTKQRRIDELLSTLKPNDTLIVAELSRLGRSVGQIITIVDELIKNSIRLIAIKERIDIDGGQDIQTKVMITMFSLFAEIERMLISERTRQGLACARAKGKKLGRPKGSIGESILNGKDDFIREEMKYGTPKSVIARKLGVGRTTLINYIKTRKL